MRVQEDRCGRPGPAGCGLHRGRGSSGPIGGIVAARSVHGVAARGTSV